MILIINLDLSDSWREKNIREMEDWIFLFNNLGKVTVFNKNKKFKLCEIVTF